MSATTQIHTDKVQAYLATSYRIGAVGKGIVLKIGQRSVQLASIFASNTAHCAAFITAFNPRGSIQPDALNQRAHEQLGHQLQALGLQIIEGSGSTVGSDWPAERSYFALDLGIELASDIGKRFDQDAIVWIGSDLVPQLVLLR